MRSEDLFNAIGEIDHNLIEAAKPTKVYTYHKKVFKLAVCLAACICLIFVGYSAKMSTRDKLNSLDLRYMVFEPMGMGYEGTDDLTLNNSDNINPWTKDAVIERLPVYINLRYNDGKLSQTYYSADDLRKQTEIFAKALNLDIISGEIIAGEEENEVYNYILQTKQGQLSTNGTGFSFNIKNDYDNLLNAHTRYCYGNKEKVTGVYREYSTDGKLLGEKKRSYYDCGNLEENIIAFNMQSHYESKDVGYTNSRNEDFISSSLLYGNYPIITWQQAQIKLIKGEYANPLDESHIIGGKLTEESIADVDLIYYTVGNQKFYIPYYRFYIKYYSADSDNQRYAYVYICAIEDKYIQNNENSEWSFQ